MEEKKRKVGECGERMWGENVGRECGERMCENARENENVRENEYAYQTNMKENKIFPQIKRNTSCVVSAISFKIFHN
jgi:hypothetical protein